MASVNESKRNCFSFIWKLENVNYCWQSDAERIESPSFIVDEIHETNWKLELYPCIEKNNVGLFLRRHADNKGVQSVTIDCDLSFLSSDGAIRHVYDSKNSAIENYGVIGKYLSDDNVASQNEVFSERSVLLSQETFTARCRMWKSIGEMSKDVQCFAHSRIAVEKKSFLWNIANFSNFRKNEKETYEIKSHGKGRSLMSLELFWTGGMVFDETIRFKIIPNYQNIKMSTFQLSIVDSSKNTMKCFQDEFWCRDPFGSKDFTLFCTKDELLEKKNAYLPDDVLSLWCECAFSFGTVQGEIEKVVSDCIAVAKMKSDIRSLDKENEFSVPKCILLDNLKSVLNNSCLSDVKLRTKIQTYPAHKTILGARSPVFKAMFSNEMKEKFNECVDIDDLNDDTALRLLRYIYSADVEELTWSSATQLYEAADKYEVLNLKDICSSYLRNNLCPSNACEGLVLADLHQDQHLKSFVQDFILRHGKDIINSEEWEQLMETNLKLAAETMHLKYKEKLQ